MRYILFWWIYEPLEKPILHYRITAPSKWLRWLLWPSKLSLIQRLRRWKGTCIFWKPPTTLLSQSLRVIWRALRLLMLPMGKTLHDFCGNDPQFLHDDFKNVDDYAVGISHGGLYVINFWFCTDKWTAASPMSVLSENLLFVVIIICICLIATPCASHLA